MEQIAVCLSRWSLKILIVCHPSRASIRHLTRATSLGTGFILLARLEWRWALRLPLAGWPLSLLVSKYEVRQNKRQPPNNF
jgi:hypothetical protein